MDMATMRDLLVARLDDHFDHPEIPKFYENAETIDLDQVGDCFMKVEIDFYGATQSCLGESPFHRTYGSMAIILMSKIGLGTRQRLVLMDELTRLFKFQVLGGGLHVQVPTPGRSEEHDGWHSAALAVPFFADSNA